MPFEIQSFDAKSAFASAVAPQWLVRCRNAVTSFGSVVVARSAGGIRPRTNSFWPGSDSAPPPEPDLLWRWLCSAASWLLTLAVEGFAAYGNAMYPGLYHPEQHGGGNAQAMEPHRAGLPYGQQENEVHIACSAFKGDTAAKLNPCAGSKTLLAVGPERWTGVAARLVMFSTKWRCNAEARRQAVLLSRFSDHLLRDIGVARDQIAGYTHHDHYGE